MTISLDKLKIYQQSLFLFIMFHITNVVQQNAHFTSEHSEIKNICFLLTFLATFYTIGLNNISLWFLKGDVILELRIHN